MHARAWLPELPALRDSENLVPVEVAAVGLFVERLPPGRLKPSCQWAEPHGQNTTGCYTSLGARQTALAHTSVPCRNTESCMNPH